MRRKLPRAAKNKAGDGDPGAKAGQKKKTVRKEKKKYKRKTSPNSKTKHHYGGKNATSSSSTTTPSKQIERVLDHTDNFQASLNNTLFTWQVKSDKDHTDSVDDLKIKLSKVYKPVNRRYKNTNESILRSIISSRKTKDNRSDNVAKKPSSVKKNVENVETVILARPQPFTTNDDDDHIISGKTGQRKIKGSGGKLFPLKKVRNSYINLNLSPQSSTSYDRNSFAYPPSYDD